MSGLFLCRHERAQLQKSQCFPDSSEAGEYGYTEEIERETVCGGFGRKRESVSRGAGDER